MGSRITLASLACLLLPPCLAACGTAKVQPPPPRISMLGARPSAQPTVFPGQLPPGSGQDAQALRAMVAAAHAQVPGLEATIETYDKGPRGQETNTIRIAYKKPYTMRIEMVKAAGTAQGARILWTGSDTLRIKPSFLPLAVEKRIDDAQTVSKNGWTIRHTGVHAIFKVLLDPAAQVRALGSQIAEGRPVEALELRSGESPAGATHEVIGLDPTQRLPVVRAVYRGPQLLYRATIKQMKVRPITQADLAL
ncbi:MAG: hypothetical protein VKQ33_00080 [Candidatus Sericytochromatia bacterium]|nr:hypothetical protein [Candidatus Sericytochromatia bacterium]